MNAPRFAVIIAACNAETTLPETLGSLCAQTYRDWEAVVVDDGSWDRTRAIAEESASREPRLTVLSQQNTGAGVARNRGAAATSAHWVVGLDADDLLRPEALERMARFMDAHGGFDLYSFGADLLLPDGSEEPWAITSGIAAPVSFTLDDMIRGNHLLSVMNPVRRGAFESVGGFRDVYVEDYDLWLRLLAAGARHIYDPERLWLYRASTSGKNARRTSSMSATAKVLADLARSPQLNRTQRRTAAARSRVWEARAARAELEAAPVDGSQPRLRSLYLKARRAYPARLQWLAALPLVLLCPGAWHRRRSLDALDRPDR
jgi:GT2 family glycosyltransferase